MVVTAGEDDVSLLGSDDFETPAATDRTIQIEITEVATGERSRD